MDFSSMDKLELEGAETNNEEGISEFSENSYTQEDMIDVSCKIVSLLEEKKNSHNENCSENQVSLNELKSVFLRSTKECPESKYPEKTCAQLGIAKINMFLREIDKCITILSD